MEGAVSAHDAGCDTHSSILMDFDLMMLDGDASNVTKRITDLPMRWLRPIVVCVTTRLHLCR